METALVFITALFKLREKMLSLFILIKKGYDYLQHLFYISYRRGRKRRNYSLAVVTCILSNKFYSSPTKRLNYQVKIH